MRHQFYDSLKLCAEETSKSGVSRCSGQFVVSDHSPDNRPEITTHFIDTSNGFLSRSTNTNILPVAETYAENISREFSDAMSNDWSLFTSSDEASFTTDSPRDSFSTVDYGDVSNMDPISSIFNYPPNNFTNSVCYRKFSNSRPLTRFYTESIQKPFLS